MGKTLKKNLLLTLLVPAVIGCTSSTMFDKTILGYEQKKND